MEPILVILAVLAVALIAGTFYVVNRTTGRRGPDLEPPSRGGVLAPPRPEGGVVVEERPPVTEPEVLEPEVLEPEVVEPEVVAPVRKPSLRDRLAKARSTFAGFLGRTRIDEETWDELEEALIRADLGVGPTTELLDQLRARVKDEGLETGEQLVEALKTEMKAQLQVSDRALRLDDGRTNVWLFVGVNGVGKTTTIGKLGKRLVGDGHQVVMAAGDTFRAAAPEQL
ncbi:MAG TPA: signal recognition particle receptor subunit alpha, partial [Acidimicrobiales bacterium]|nr:signal recognition particle receptor subunit alpha [Acidimicrobiales bacterium]